MFPAILKLLTPKLIRTIISYVTEENELDIEVKQINNRLEELEAHSHPKRELICNRKGKKKCELVE